jgi:hypothetical protein
MKRRGVIAYLAAAAASLTGQSKYESSESSGRSTSLTLSQKQRFSLTLVDKDGPEAWGVDEIELSYKGEKLTLTAKEIWDALKGK